MFYQPIVMLVPMSLTLGAEVGIALSLGARDVLVSCIVKQKDNDAARLSQKRTIVTFLCRP